MDIPKGEKRCTKCEGQMVRGKLQIRGTPAARVRVEFVVPGVATSMNPIKAFRQRG